MDSKGTRVQPGEQVAYHGSLTGLHGTWIYTGTCGSCCMYESGDELPECRFTLQHPVTGQVLSHVRAASFTRA